MLGRGVVEEAGEVVEEAEADDSGDGRHVGPGPLPGRDVRPAAGDVPLHCHRHRSVDGSRQCNLRQRDQELGSQDLKKKRSVP